MSTAAPVNLGDISLRHKERGLILGGVDSGKSTLSDILANDFVHRYLRRGVRRLIVDTKPRYRAQFCMNGTLAAPRYKNWTHGPYIPNSYVVDKPTDLDVAFKIGATTCIVQPNTDHTLSEMPRIIATVRRFLAQSKESRPQLAQVDETLDFFHGNGQPIGGDPVIIQLARAGRERGTAVIYCSQRLKGLPYTLRVELARLYCLRLDGKLDVKELREIGAPEFTPPTRLREFYYWWKGDIKHPQAYHQVWGPYTLDLGGSAA